jgi:hypothetical protein
MADLQFDRAQFEAPTETTCASCARPLADRYFEVNGKLACEVCRHKAEEEWNSGSGMARFLKATAFGVVGAVLGALLYWGLTKAFKGQLSLVSIAVGWIVGVSVRVGSNGRGGWGYQLLAMFLTYSSIAGSYLPDVMEEIQGGGAFAHAFAVVYSYALPFLVVYASRGGYGVIGLVIIGIGLWQAWSMNRKTTLQIAGPFSLVKPRPSEPAPDPAA